MVSNLKKKKGTSGTAVLYCTRNQALSRLQLRLAEFRRLCILKGVHPREPKRKVAGQNKTYYHVKDVAFLQHEPLLAAFRAQRAHARKVRRAKGKAHLAGAERLAAAAPTYRLDGLVRERYPTFEDALRDLNDPLTLVHLFAVLPAERAHRISAERVHASKRLSVEFQAFVALTGALRKAFVSVKGIYFQASVCGETITWLVPHCLTQLLPSDVDYRVMLTFLEFDEALLRFVNFRLYHSLGLPYPPPLDGALTAQGAPSVFATASSVGAAQPDSGNDDHQGDDDDAALAGAMEEGGGGHSRADDEGARGHLFRGLVFFLSREVNIEALSFVIRACGGRCGWDGQSSPLTEGDGAITHHVVDRPSLPASTRALVDAQSARDGAGGRVFVQPQWVFDSVNFGIACPAQPYAVGAALPPHLSPFVQPTADGGYAPDFLDTVADWQAAARGQRPQLRAGGRSDAAPGGEGQAAAGGAGAATAYAEQLAAEFSGRTFSAAAAAAPGDVSGGAAPPEGDGDDPEAAKLKAALLPRKKKELYKAMQMGLVANQAKAEKLRNRKDARAGKA